MRKFIGLAFGVLALTAVPAGAQQKPQGSATQSADRILFTRGKISFPRTIAGLAFKETKDFSHHGEGLDTSVRYETADGAIFATAYLYYPSLSHGGLAGIATEEAIRGNSTEATSLSPLRRIPVGKIADGGLQMDIGNYQGRYASSAAFVKAGRWMVKYRVSGPEARKAEIEAAIAALVDATRFEGEARPVPSAPLELENCPLSGGKDARLIAPTGGSEGNAATMSDAMIASFDAAGETPNQAKRSEAFLSRIGSGWCKSYAEVGKSRIPLLRATGGIRTAPGAASSRLFALYSDAGGALEVVGSGKRFTLLHHEIGKTTVMGAFDSVPSDGQMAEILGGNHEALRPRARVDLSPEGGSKINLQLADGPGTPTI